ncbi:MAG: class I SAM-dependent methyltransferase [Acidobacteria bacterium]|nr:class I SAM-dependent methyltransferase [Acidobacteriota bacterium]
MSHDETPTLFFELFDGLPRQGPGDAASTRRALALVPGVGPDTRVLDVGCGTGTQTLVLAAQCAASFVAVDNHPPFIEEVRRRARAAGVAGRIEARVGDMRQLDFPDASFDVIWSEGAIYVMGFEEGLRSWRRLLAPGGHVAVTEACWLRPDPSPECAAFWAAEYPAIRDVATCLASVAACGYEMVGHFGLPASAWWDDYYRPLQDRVIAFRKRHADEPDAQRLADQVQREIDVWRAYSDVYGYVFFVMRAA